MNCALNGSLVISTLVSRLPKLCHADYSDNPYKTSHDMKQWIVGRPHYLNCFINPSKKVWKLFSCSSVSHFIQFLFARYMKSSLSMFSKMTPPRPQSDDPGLRNSREQADGSQSKSGKITIILDTIEHSFIHPFINFSIRG